MALATLSPFLLDLRGKLGGSIYFRRFCGRLLLCKMPEYKKPPSEKQRRQREAFKQAMAYAKAALKDPERAAMYRERAQLRGISPIALAVQDYLRSPQQEADVVPSSALVQTTTQAPKEEKARPKLMEVRGTRYKRAPYNFRRGLAYKARTRVEGRNAGLNCSWVAIIDVVGTRYKRAP